MPQESTFRILFSAWLLIFGSIGLYHRIKSITGEKLDRRQEGIFLFIALRLLGLASMLSLLVYLVAPGWLAWAYITIPLLYRWLGVLFLFSAGVLLAWTLHTLGGNLTDTVVIRREHYLVTHGPYRWVRHPFYVSAAVLYASAVLITGSLLLFISGFLTLAVLIVRTQKEEDRLLQRFGDEYRKYMQRTGRFLPGLNSNHF